MGTPQDRWRDRHQSGRTSIIPRIRSRPQAGIQVTRSISAKAFFLRSLALHGDKPLLGGPKDNRIFTAPAMGIAVFDGFFPFQGKSLRAVVSLTVSLASKTNSPAKNPTSGVEIFPHRPPENRYPDDSAVRFHNPPGRGPGRYERSRCRPPGLHKGPGSSPIPDHKGGDGIFCPSRNLGSRPVRITGFFQESLWLTFSRSPLARINTSSPSWTAT